MLSELLKKWDNEGLEEKDFQQFECLRHAVDSRQQLVEVLQNHPVPSGSIVLELGADHCWTSNLFLDRGCRVIAVDITNHLELASRKSDPHLCRVYADMNQLPLRPQSVDVVWATSAAHHTWDLNKTFQECNRILKPDGMLYFCCEPIPSWLRYFFGKDFGHQEREAGINEMWIPRQTWLKACRDSGFHPQLLFPAMDRASIQERLRKRNIPRIFASLLLPLLKQLQVSIHLKATKKVAPAARRQQER